MTEQEQFAMEETRRFVYARAGYRCEVCGKPLNFYSTAQLAHRIPQTKQNIAKYGKEIIHHPLNLAAVCCLRCNAKVDIRNHPVLIKKLVEKIKGGSNGS